MSPSHSKSSSTPLVIAKRLRWVLTALQLTGAIYAVWVLWLITAPLRNSTHLLAWLGQVWGHPLTQVQGWQLGAYVLVDVLVWGVMALAIARSWQAAQFMKQVSGSESVASRKLIAGAWLALGAELLSLLSRPLKSSIMTCCDATGTPLVHWSFAPQDLLVLMLILALLGLAHVFSWKVYLAEENKGFV